MLNVKWCESLFDRLPLIHLKDYGMNEETNPDLCDTAKEDLTFKRIIAATEKADFRLFIVEQETCP